MCNLTQFLKANIHPQNLLLYSSINYTSFQIIGLYNGSVSVSCPILQQVVQLLKKLELYRVHTLCALCICVWTSKIVKMTQLYLLMISTSFYRMSRNHMASGVYFERGFYFIYVCKARAKFFGHAHFVVTRPTFIPFMAIVTINMISGRPPVCVIWKSRW